MPTVKLDVDSETYQSQGKGRLGSRGTVASACILTRGSMEGERDGDRLECGRGDRGGLAAGSVVSHRRAESPGADRACEREESVLSRVWAEEREDNGTNTVI